MNHANKDGRTPLCVATFKGYLPICDLLIKHGADADLEVIWFNSKNYTKPIAIALQKDHSKIVKLLRWHTSPTSAWWIVCSWR